MMKRFVLVAVIGALLAALPARQAQAAKLYAVSAQYEASNAVIYRYEINGPDDRPAAPDLVIPVGSWPTNSPAALAFSPWEELFVFDRGPGGNGGAAGSIRRYLDPAGASPIDSGTITSNPPEFSFNTPHWGSFRGNERFVTPRYGVMERFLVEPGGVARYNGQIQVAAPGSDCPRGGLVTPWGEVFVGLCNGSIGRYLISPDGTAVENGSISGNGLNWPHGMTFSSWGELFVTGTPSKILRFTFDAGGVATLSGEISSAAFPGAPDLFDAVGYTFAPWGELFVSHHLHNQISRWIVGPNGRAEFNGVITTPSGPIVDGLGDVAFLLPEVRDGACAPPPPGLVSWWPGQGNAADVAGNHDGRLTGTATFAPGKVGKGFTFPATYDGVLIPSAPALELQDFTIDAWVKRSRTDLAGSGPDGEGEIFVYGQLGYGFGMWASGQLFVTLVGISGAWSGDLTITDTEFHHVAVTKSGSSVVFYVDGMATRAQAYDVTFSFQTPAAIGNRGDSIASPASGNPPGSFFGVVDEVDVFRRALAPEEVRSIYRAGGTGKCRVISIGIDVKPGVFPNAIDPRARGRLPVAILTTNGFDAATVNRASVRFGDGRARPVSSALRDVDGDGDLDLLLQFNAQDTGIVCGTTSARLTGRTVGGLSIEGSDSVTTVGCK